MVLEHMGVEGVISLVHFSTSCEGVSPAEWQKVKQIAEEIIHDNPRLYGGLF